MSRVFVHYYRFAFWSEWSNWTRIVPDFWLIRRSY